MQLYYVLVKNETRGPYSVSELCALRDRGQIDGETPVANEGDEAWQKISDLCHPNSTTFIEEAAASARSKPPVIKQNPRRSVGIGVIAGISLCVFVLLIGFVVWIRFHQTSPLGEAETTQASNSEPQGVQPTPVVDTRPPIDGLFGIKLGEPMPSGCRIRSTVKGSGHTTDCVDPLEPNELFSRYTVSYSDRDPRLYEISGHGYPKDMRADNSLLDALRERYGPENKKEFHHSDDGRREKYSAEEYIWKRGGRTLTFKTGWLGLTQFIGLSCVDEQLKNAWVSERPPVDTRGL